MQNNEADESASLDDTMERLALSIVEDEAPPPDAAIQSNPKGLQIGYNPYESGLLTKKEWKPKRNLQELSKWVSLKRRMKNEVAE